MRSEVIQPLSDPDITSEKNVKKSVFSYRFFFPGLISRGLVGLGLWHSSIPVL